VYEEYHEGEITFLAPPPPRVPTTSMPVFYNPRSELNRDVTICGIQVFLNQHNNMEAKVCTPLAGTGVRSIRIAKEVHGISKVVAGDINPLAVKLIIKNSKLNKVEHLVEVYHGDANLLLVSHHHSPSRFDIIDIDPFGSPRPFLAAAVGALRSPALLCLTATDMPVLMGIRRRTCIKRYAAEPARTEYSSEVATRLLLGCVVREAAAQDFGIEPLLSLYIDHYVRILCKAERGDSETWKALSCLGYLIHCNSCGFRQMISTFTPPPNACPECKETNVKRAGPLWVGKLSERFFIERTLQQVQLRSLGTRRRLERVLKRILEEIDAPPTYYNLHMLCDELGISIPPFKSVIHALRSEGYSCTRTHFSPHAIRTNASLRVISRVIQELAKRRYEVNESN